MPTLLLTLLAGCMELEPVEPTQDTPQPTFERSMLDGFDIEIGDALEHYRVPGAVVTVIYGDHPVFSQSFGERRTGTAQALSDQTLFRLGSLTRVLSSSLLATLVDEQRLDWNGLLPGDLEGLLSAAALREQADRFGAALAHEPGDGQATAQAPADSLADLLALSSVSEKARMAPDLFAAAVLRGLDTVADGERDVFRRALQERLVGPAAMVRTVVADRLPGLVEDFASPHALTEGGDIERIDYPPAISMPSAGVASTAADLGRFLSVHIEGGISQSGKRVVSGNNLDASRRSIYTLEAPDGAAPLAEQCCGWGGGWSTAELGDGYRWVGAEGAADGYAGLIGFLPERRLGLVVLANLEANHGGRDFTREVRDALLGHLLDRAGTVAHRLDHEKSLKRLERLQQSLGAADARQLSAAFGDYEGGWTLGRSGGDVVLTRGLEELRLRSSGDTHVLVDDAHLGTEVTASAGGLVLRGLDGSSEVLSPRSEAR